MFDVTIKGYGSCCRAAVAFECDRLGRVRRHDVPHLSRFFSRADRFHPGTGQGLSGRQRAASRWRQSGTQRPAGTAAQQDCAADEGVAHTIDLAGYSTILSTNISNAAGMFVILSPFEERAGKPELAAPAIIAKLRQKFSEFQEAQVAVFGAPAGRRSRQHGRLQAAGSGPSRGRPAIAARGCPEFRRRVAQTAGPGRRVLDVQRRSAAAVRRNRSGKGEGPGRFAGRSSLALQTYLGSAYVNDFSFQNRNWQVNVQADPRYRMRAEDIGKLEVRNASGDPVPLATLLTVKDTSGPPIVNHYNLYPSAELNGATAPGVSSGQAIAMMDDLATNSLPTTMGYEWTELTYQQILASKDILTKLAFPLGVLVRVPRARRPVRKLVVAAGDHPDRSDVHPGRPDGCMACRPGQQHFRPDRSDRVDWAGGQECDLDRRIRQAT